MEHLDSRQQSDDWNEQRFYENIGRKYAHQDWDLFILIDGPALESAARHRDFFGDRPIVHSGVEPYILRAHSAHTQMTGVTEMATPEKTLRLMQDLFPRRKNVYMLSGDVQFKQVKEAALRDFPLEQPFNFIQIEYRGPEDLLDFVSHIPTDALLLEVGFESGWYGKYMSPEFKTEITRRASVPYFSNYQLGEGWGIGGHVIQGVQYGHLAAEAAIRVLEGEAASEVQIDLARSQSVILDHRELVRFGADLSRIPKGTIVRNPPDKLIRHYRSTFYLLGGFVAGLACLTAFLLRSNRQNRMLFEQASDGIVVLNRAGLILKANPSAAALFCHTDELIGVAFDTLVERETGGGTQEVDSDRDGKRLRSKETFVRGDGSRFVGDCVTNPLPGGRLQKHIRDNSEAERANQLLRESEETLSLRCRCGGGRYL